MLHPSRSVRRIEKLRRRQILARSGVVIVPQRKRIQLFAALLPKFLVRALLPEEWKTNAMYTQA